MKSKSTLKKVKRDLSWKDIQMVKECISIMKSTQLNSQDKVYLVQDVGLTKRSREFLNWWVEYGEDDTQADYISTEQALMHIAMQDIKIKENNFLTLNKQTTLWD